MPALVSQLAEETDSKPVQCRFESDRGHHITARNDCRVSGCTARCNHFGVLAEMLETGDAATHIARRLTRPTLLPLRESAGLAALSRIAKRLNAAHEIAGSNVKVSPIMTWLWAPIWFASHTRYLQRRVNILATVTGSKQTQNV